MDWTQKHLMGFISAPYFLKSNRLVININACHFEGGTTDRAIWQIADSSFDFLLKKVWLIDFIIFSDYFLYEKTTAFF